MNVRLFQSADDLMGACRDILDRIESSTLVSSVASSERLGRLLMGEAATRVDLGTEAPFCVRSSTGSPSSLQVQGAEPEAAGDHLFDAVLIDVTEVDSVGDVIDRIIPRSRHTYLVATGSSARPILASLQQRKFSLPVGDELWCLVVSDVGVAEG